MTRANKKAPYQTYPPSAGQSPLTAIKKGGGLGARQAIKKQDEIFKKMSPSKKLRLSSQLAAFCLKLNQLNGNHRPAKISS